VTGVTLKLMSVLREFRSLARIENVPFIKGYKPFSVVS